MHSKKRFHAIYDRARKILREKILQIVVFAIYLR